MSVTDLLKEPFDPKVVHWRVGATNKKKIQRDSGNNNAKATKGIALAYLDARDVMKRFDEVCGDNWQAKAPYKGYCEIGVKIEGEWLWRGNGAGETDVEGEKGQYSDAFKRAAVLWGVARYLYYLPNQWVELDNYGKFTPPALPDWAKPDSNRFKPHEREEIISQMIECLNSGDEVGVKQIYGEYKGTDQELKFWALFDSTERSVIKKLTSDE